MNKKTSHGMLVLGMLLSITWGASAWSAAEETALKPTAEGIVDGSANIAPRLEIRKYRFFHDSKLGRERLVLEFDRRDFYHEAKPRLSYEALSAQEILIKLENAVMMGAIPESLINDSYANSSQYMGAISMDDRSMNAGLAMKVKLKDYDLGYHAEWLSGPDRLVIDVFPKNSAAAKKAVASTGTSKGRTPRSLAVEHRSHIPNFSDFLCFPAKAKVGIAVVFQPHSTKEEDVQKFRVNIDGSSAGLVTSVDKESIVCYPKESQVKASLSFLLDESKAKAEGEANGAGAQAPTAGLLNFATPPASPPPPASASLLPPPTAGTNTGAAIPAPVTGGSDADLEPPTATGTTEGKSLGPASLLPPIGK